MSGTGYDFFRCPHCGGLNPNGAEWCAQCQARFEPRRPRPPRDGSAPDEPPAYIEALAGILGVDADRPADAIERVFDPERGPVWTCACGEEVALSADVCPACGTTFRDTAKLTVREAAAERRADGEALANDLAGGVLAATSGGPLAPVLALAAVAVAAVKALVRRAVRGRRIRV